MSLKCTKCIKNYINNTPRVKFANSIHMKGGDIMLFVRILVEIAIFTILLLGVFNEWNNRNK